MKIQIKDIMGSEKRKLDDYYNELLELAKNIEKDSKKIRNIDDDVYRSSLQFNLGPNARKKMSNILEDYSNSIHSIITGMDVILHKEIEIKE